MTHLKPDRFYRRGPRGLTEVPPDKARVGAWVCRRVVDFPPDDPVPPDAAFARCAGCGADLAYNPARADQVPPDTPKLCFACAGFVRVH